MASLAFALALAFLLDGLTTWSALPHGRELNPLLPEVLTLEVYVLACALRLGLGLGVLWLAGERAWVRLGLSVVVALKLAAACSNALVQ